MSHRSFTALAFLALGSFATASDEAPLRHSALDASPTLFFDVIVVTPTRDAPLHHATVRVVDGRITELGERTAPLTKREGERVIDGHDALYLVPGFVDMHLHLAPDDGRTEGSATRAACLLLANGVTTIRNLAGNPAHLALRKRIEDGEFLGPTLYAAGPAMHVNSVKSVDDGVAAVRAQSAAGYDLVKSHHLVDPSIWEAIQATAKEVSLPVAGHVTNEVGLDRAIANLQQVEHLDGFVKALATSLEGVPEFEQFPVPEVFEPFDSKDRIDLSRLAPLAKRFAEIHLPNTPTLALFETACDLESTTEQLAARDEMKYIPKKARAAWVAQRNEARTAGFPPPAMAKPFVALRRKIVLALDAANAPLFIGSDCPQEFMVEGFATHREMEALEVAGISPAHVLAAATQAPADYFSNLPKNGSASGFVADFGAIEIGRRADLVLLRADPLQSTKNLREIEGVMLRGKWLDRAALDALLAKAKAIAEK